MCYIKENLRNNSKVFHFLIAFLFGFHCIYTKVIETDDCPLIDSKGFGQSSHKPEGYQSNTELTVTPRIAVPLELTGSVDTGFTIGLPIKVKFQSQIQLMSDWIKQYLATKTNRLTKNFNSFSASITQLLGLLNPGSNAGPNSGEQHIGHSTDGILSTGAIAGDGLSNIDPDNDTSAAYSSESNLFADSFERKDSHKHVLQNKIANNSRVQARNFLFKSIEISHSSLGKSCLLRAICEVSQTPLFMPSIGLIGEIIDMFLTIDSLYESFPDFEDYMNAQTVGRNSFVKQSGNRSQNHTFVDECRLYYANDCPFSLFNINHILPSNL